MKLKRLADHGNQACPEALRSHGVFKAGSITVRSACEQEPSDCHVESGPGRWRALVGGCGILRGSWRSRGGSKQRRCPRLASDPKGHTAFTAAWPAWRGGWLIPGKTSSLGLHHPPTTGPFQGPVPAQAVGTDVGNSPKSGCCGTLAGA